MSFDKLTHAELLRHADEDLAFALTDDEKKSKKLTLAAFAEAELKFSDYLAANPDQAEKFAPAPAPVLVEEVLVAPSAPETGEFAPQPGNTVVNNVVVREAIPVVQSAPFLIKMVRENPYYEIGRYKFTDSHPYVLVAAEDAEYVLENEGFRQAFPSELAEYYG